MDTKAVVHVGEYSRGGKSRTLEPIKALDHDMRPKQKIRTPDLAPFQSDTGLKTSRISVPG